LFEFSRYTINLTAVEAERINSIRIDKSKEIIIRPKKVFYNESENEIQIYDWFLDYDLCPFIDSYNKCLIYEYRPEICSSFPKETKDLKIDDFVLLHHIKRPRTKYEVAYANVYSKLKDFTFLSYSNRIRFLIKEVK
jgi:Fe-S-cluster containining protein